MMGTRSCAGDKWLLFAREEDGDVVFTAVVTQEKNVVAELKVDADALKNHVEKASSILFLV